MFDVEALFYVLTFVWYRNTHLIDSEAPFYVLTFVWYRSAFYFLTFVWCWFLTFVWCWSTLLRSYKCLVLKHYFNFSHLFDIETLFYVHLFDIETLFYFLTFVWYWNTLLRTFVWNWSTLLLSYICLILSYKISKGHNGWLKTLTEQPTVSFYELFILHIQTIKSWINAL
jgi:hypothetical protein